MANLIPCSDRFSYTALERIDTPNGRRYVLPDGVQVPSVTTILDRTKDKSHLKAWADRVGHDQAEKIKNEAAYVGTNMHLVMEKVLANEPLPLAQDWLAMRGYEMGFRLISTYFKHLSVSYGSEVGLYYPKRYAGTTDLVAEYRGKLAIVDFKQSVRPKRHEHITDYFHQLAAYAVAHDQMHGTNIDFAAVLISVQDGTTQEFTTTGPEFENYKDQWMKRLSLAQAAVPVAQP